MCKLFHRRFKSNYFYNGLGFELGYESSNVSLWSYSSGTWSGNFTTPNGVITSPSFPENYTEDMDCTYFISQLNKNNITIRFSVFDVHRFGFGYGGWKDTECEYSDYLEIRDGSSGESPVLAKLCGNEIPAPIQTTQNHVWIR